MKQKLKDILDCNIRTLDNQKASIKDILFDSQSWNVQYLEADFGSFFSSNRILIPKALIKQVDTGNDILFVNITQSQIEKCPKPEDDLPISRKYEEALNKHYQIDNYWSTFPGTGTLNYNADDFNQSDTKREIDETNLGTNLRSFNEMKGYSIRATDGTLGKIDDLVIHDQSWHISYLIVDTNKWLPWSKKVMLDVSFINSISYEAQEVHINLHSDSIKDAPEYDSSIPIDDQYENNLHTYYEKSSYQHH